MARRTIVDEEIGLFTDKVTTDFIALRLEYELSLKWYTALDLRYIHLQPLDESKLGSSVEIGYLLTKNLQVGLGYSIQNFDDPDFAMENQSFRNFFLTMHMKFSQNIFNWK